MTEQEQIAELSRQVLALRSVIRKHMGAYPVTSVGKINQYIELEQALTDTEQAGRDAEARIKVEALDEAVRVCMPGPCGQPDDPPAGYQEYCEGVASVRDYANRLRNGGSDDAGS